MNTNTKTDATTAFMKEIQEIQSVLATLQEKANDNFWAEPDEINWAHVGDLKRIASLLRQANG